MTSTAGVKRAWLITIIYAFSAILGLEEQSFAEEPTDVEAKIGERVVLPCRVANRRGRIQWTKGDFGLGIERSLKDWPRYAMIEEIPDSWSLEIDPVQLDDDDYFQCQVFGSETSSAMRSRKSKVSVFTPPGSPIILGDPIKETRETATLELRCISEGGKPAARIDWYDDRGNLLNDRATIAYRSTRMSRDESSLDYKLFTSTSVLRFTPTLQSHNRTYRCEAWNEAGRAIKSAFVTLNVKYSPSVAVTPIRPGVVHEGDKIGFRCSVLANPPPHERSYRWYIENEPIPGHNGFYYEIYNVSRNYNDKQIKCTAENDLGKAQGVRTIQVEYGPSFVEHPQTIAGDRDDTLSLFCIVDSNPPAKYFWTKDDSREVISNSQNLTLRLSERTVGEYYCHAIASGYSAITAFPASVLLKGKPVLLSKKLQRGVIGQDVHVNCEARCVPEPSEVIWKYHDKVLSEKNPHYRIVNSPMDKGVRSTLIVRGTVDADFGVYKCQVRNSYGQAEHHIVLERKRPFPLLVIIVTIFTGVILLLTIMIVVILCRKRLGCCGVYGGGKSSPIKQFSSHPQEQLNNAMTIDHPRIPNTNILIRNKDSIENLDSPEADSACWDASDSQEGLYRLRSENGEILSTQLYRDTSDGDPDFPPKPDVISTGYIRYGNYVRDFEPPRLKRDSLYSAGVSQSVLNVSDPRYSGTFGHSYPRQIPPGVRGPSQYSTFYPHPPSSTLERQVSIDKRSSFSSQQPLALMDEIVRPSPTSTPPTSAPNVPPSNSQPSLTLNRNIKMENTSDSQNCCYGEDQHPHQFSQPIQYPPLNTTTTSNGGLATHV